MMYVQIAATTNHTAFTASPRANAMIAQATAPITAMIPKMILCRTVIGERSIIATAGNASSVRIKLTSLFCSAICFVTVKPYDDCEAAAGCL